MAHITVNDVTPKDQYTATAGQTEFTVSWPFFEDDSLAVYQTAKDTSFDETTDLLTLSTHYTVTGAGNVAGVTRKITLVTGATAGDIITIIRVEPIERTTDFQNNGDLLAETLNDEQDKELMIMQQLDEKLDRSFKLSLFETGISAELPAPDALKIFRWNAAANAIEYVAASTLSTTLATSNWVVDSFVDGTDFTAGTTTQLTLSQEPGVIQNTWIFFDGVPQHQTEYSLAVDVITFTSAIPVGTNKVEVRQNQALDQGFTDASAVTYTPAGSGAVATDVQTKLREIISDNDFSVADRTTAQSYLDRLGETVNHSSILNDVTVSDFLQISKSTILTGGVKDKGDKVTITTGTGKSGIKVTKTFAAGVDENMVNVAVNELKIKEATNSKAAGTSGLLYDRVNVGAKGSQLEIEGFEKGLHLKGVIGGIFEGVNADTNTYGLYTERNNDATLPVYDCTNTQFVGGSFNANATGVYLGVITQGVNFFGTNIERNTVAGVEIDTTPPAGSVVNFFGAWFEGNPIAALFTEKPSTVQFDGCYFFDNTELWDNGGSGTINGTFERCKIESSHIDLDMFQGRFVDNDCTTCTFTATTPTAYQVEEWRGTAVTVSDGNTLYSTRSIGSGRYAVEASGAPGSTALNDGSTWLDIATGKNYVKVSSVWQEIESAIVTTVTLDLPSIAAGSSHTHGPFTVTGAAVGDHIQVIPGLDCLGLMCTGYVSGVNAVTLKFYNNTSGAIDLASADYRVRVQK